MRKWSILKAAAPETTKWMTEDEIRAAIPYAVELCNGDLFDAGRWCETRLSSRDAILDEECVKGDWFYLTEITHLEWALMVKLDVSVFFFEDGKTAVEFKLLFG